MTETEIILIMQEMKRKLNIINLETALVEDDLQDLTNKKEKLEKQLSEYSEKIIN